VVALGCWGDTKASTS